MRSKIIVEEYAGVLKEDFPCCLTDLNASFEYNI
jgi:hypothetical protein